MEVKTKVYQGTDCIRQTFSSSYLAPTLTALVLLNLRDLSKFLFFPLFWDGKRNGAALLQGAKYLMLLSSIFTWNYFLQSSFESYLFEKEKSLSQIKFMYFQASPDLLSNISPLKGFQNYSTEFIF